ncbi:MAG: hypothetical protein HOV80_29575 [Polyangiaceae bacterium]|nr:hypothetical protein [Polyangiaceae bacterium]
MKLRSTAAALLLGCGFAVACGTPETGSQGDGAGAPARGGADTGPTNSGVGGSGGFDLTGGAGGTGGSEPVCGHSSAPHDGVCPDGEVCFSCESDDIGEGWISWCREEPVVGSDQFRCFFGACDLGAQYCRLVDDDLCFGNYQGQYCPEIPPECSDDPTCTCLMTLPCVLSCDGTPETGVRVVVDDICPDE